MEVSKSRLLGYVIEKYATDLLKSFETLKLNYKKVNIDINKFIPSPFDDPSTIVVNSFYYSKKDRIEINFEKGKKGRFNYSVIEGEIWKANLFNGKSGNVNEVYSLARVLPKLEPPYLETYGYGMFYSFEEFVKSNKNTIDVAHFMISTRLLFDRISEPNDTPETRLRKLESLALEFQMKLENPNTSEKDLDRFLGENKEILNVTLELNNFISEPTLKDRLQKYNQDLKPDAIAFNAKENKWVIIDYKKSQKSLLKNVGKVRTSFRSDIYDLKAQLWDYVEYFQENEHRGYFKEKYGHSINYPSAIGIIGLLDENHQRDFNRIMHDLPKWFTLYPYNYILNSFINYIDKVKKLTLPGSG